MSVKIDWNTLANGAMSSVGDQLLNTGFGALNQLIGASTQYKYQEKLMNHQNELNLQNLTKQPSLSLQGLRQAGLSTALLNGGFGSNVASPTGGTIQGMNNSSQSNILGNATQLQNIANIKADTDLKEAETQLKKAEKAKLGIETDRLTKLVPLEIAEKEANNFLLQMQGKTEQSEAVIREGLAKCYGPDTDYSKVFFANLQADFDLKNSNIKLNQSSVDKINKEISQMDEYLEIQQMIASAQMIQANASQISANAATVSAEAAKTNADAFALTQKVTRGNIGNEKYWRDRINTLQAKLLDNTQKLVGAEAGIAEKQNVTFYTKFACDQLHQGVQDATGVLQSVKGTKFMPGQMNVNSTQVNQNKFNFGYANGYTVGNND